MECNAVDIVRQPILETFSKVYETLLPPWQVKGNIVQLILDPSELISTNSGTDEVSYMDIDRHTKRMCQALHLERYKSFSPIPTRRVKSGNGKVGCSTRSHERHF